MPLTQPLNMPMLNTTCPSLFHRFTYGKKADRPAMSSLHSRASLDNYYKVHKNGGLKVSMAILDDHPVMLLKTA